MSIRRLAALAALILLVAACASGPGSGGQLDGTDWVLSSYDVDGTLTIVPETIYADASFDGSRVTGSGGCNSFQALYQANGRTLRITRPSSGLMACDPATMALEQRYLALLDGSRFFSVRGSTLTVYGSGSGATLVFDAAPRNPLLGKWRVDSYGVPPSTVTGVKPGTEIDVVFGIASVGGFAGCNSFSGTYGTNGDFLRISPLATTRLACDQPLMDQETAFLAALSASTRIDAHGNHVSLTDRKGFLQVGLVRPSAVASPGASAGASASASAAPSASASATAAATASPAPTPTPTPAPTAPPTQAPTAAPAPTPPPTSPPSAAPSVRPSPSLPASLPPTASCKLAAVDGAIVATLVYPGLWSTVTAPPNVACRYFDPAPITVPADPSTLATAVRADVAQAAYSDVVAAASDPAIWAVSLKSEVNVRGTAVTCIAASTLVDQAGLTVGGRRYACYANVQTAGTVLIWTTGSADDPTFSSRAAIVALMTAASTFTPPG